MRIYIQTQGFELTPAIQAHVEKQLKRNLASMEDQVMAVNVFLGDINGPRGGEDKKALVSVQLASRLAITPIAWYSSARSNSRHKSSSTAEAESSISAVP